jgi:hypothetical protein
MKRLLVTMLLTLGLVVALLGLWVAAHPRMTAPPVSGSLYTDAIEPELPAVSELEGGAEDRLPAPAF